MIKELFEKTNIHLMSKFIGMSILYGMGFGTCLSYINLYSAEESRLIIYPIICSFILIGFFIKNVIYAYKIIQKSNTQCQRIIEETNNKHLFE